MKSLILSVAAAALIFAAPSAFAAPDHRDGGQGGGHPAGNAHDSGHAASAHAATSNVAHTSSGGMNREMHMRTETSGTTRSHSMMNTTTSHGAGFNAQTRGNNNDRNTTRNYNNNNSNNHNYSNNNNRGSANGHANFNRHNVAAQHHYHYSGGAYRGPSGYSYRRWSYGEMLPSIYWGRDYWIDDYSDYGLGYPPPGCVWVRYGDDAVLIDQYSGEILEVVYGQFY